MLVVGCMMFAACMLMTAVNACAREIVDAFVTTSDVDREPSERIQLFPRHDRNYLALQGLSASRNRLLFICSGIMAKN